jgi:hypothetical protein
MSHEALGKTNKGRSTFPNVWFVGVTPRRNPELVVCVLWQNGEFSYYPARLGARVVSAYVEKQRRLANNLVPPKIPKPVEMGAVWTTQNPSSGAGNQKSSPDRVHAGNFLIQDGKVVTQIQAGTHQAKPAVPPVHAASLAKPPQRPEVAKLPNSRSGQ